MQSPIPRVLVAGSANMDVVATAKRHPRPGETVSGQALHFFPGGKGVNQAVAAARLGAETLLASKLGNDAFGDRLAEFLADNGVDLTYTTRTDEASTGTALIVVDASSENSIVVVPGANALLGDADVRRMSVRADDVLVSQLEIPPSTIEAFFAHGKAHAAKTLLNPAPARACSDALLHLVDVLVVNESELATLTGESRVDANDTRRLIEAATRLRRGTNHVVVVTLGAYGSLALEGDQVHRDTPLRVEAVDTTGAGDCFVGALAAQLAGGVPLRTALGFANAAASLSVREMGAGPSMPRHQDVLDAMRLDEHTR